MFASLGARHELAAFFTGFIAGANMDPAIAVRLALDATVGRIDGFKRRGGIPRNRLTACFRAHIQRVQRTISPLISILGNCWRAAGATSN
jgi:hypothetical protein